MYILCIILSIVVLVFCIYNFVELIQMLSMNLLPTDMMWPAILKYLVYAVTSLVVISSSVYKIIQQK